MHEEQKRENRKSKRRGDWPAHIIIKTSDRWNQEAEVQLPDQTAAERLLG